MDFGKLNRMIIPTVKLLLFTDRIDIERFYQRFNGNFNETIINNPIYIIDAFSYLLNFKYNEFSRDVCYTVFQENKIDILFDINSSWFYLVFNGSDIMYINIDVNYANNILKRNNNIFNWFDDGKIIKIYGLDKNNYSKNFIYLINDAKKRLNLATSNYLSYKHLSLLTSEPTQYLNSLYINAFI